MGFNLNQRRSFIALFLSGATLILLSISGCRNGSPHYAHESSSATCGMSSASEAMNPSQAIEPTASHDRASASKFSCSSEHFENADEYMNYLSKLHPFTVKDEWISTDNAIEQAKKRMQEVPVKLYYDISLTTRGSDPGKPYYLIQVFAMDDLRQNNAHTYTYQWYFVDVLTGKIYVEDAKTSILIEAESYTKSMTSQGTSGS